MTRTINLSNTQFRYQLVFFVHICGYIWLAEGCLWHFLPQQNLLSASFAQVKQAAVVCFDGSMILLIQCYPSISKIEILKKQKRDFA